MYMYIYIYSNKLSTFNAYFKHSLHECLVYLGQYRVASLVGYEQVSGDDHTLERLTTPSTQHRERREDRTELQGCRNREVIDL